MTTRKLLFAFVVLAVSLSFSACVLEYDFDDPAPPWRIRVGDYYQYITRLGASGAAEGWTSNVDVVVTLDVMSGWIRNVRIDGPGETPSRTRDLIQNAERMAELLNSFDFLDAMSGNTVTRHAIRDAGREALEDAGVVFGSP